MFTQYNSKHNTAAFSVAIYAISTSFHRFVADETFHLAGMTAVYYFISRMVMIYDVIFVDF